MSRKMRNKFMGYEECSAVQNYEWTPVELVGNARPNWMKNLPSDTRVFGSGSHASGISTANSGMVLLGYAIFRPSPDDPVPFNKDCYHAISGWNPSGLIVQGPSKDNDHWTNQIPYSGVPVIGFEQDSE